MQKHHTAGTSGARGTRKAESRRGEGGKADGAVDVRLGTTYGGRPDQPPHSLPLHKRVALFLDTAAGDHHLAPDQSFDVFKHRTVASMIVVVRWTHCLPRRGARESRSCRIVGFRRGGDTMSSSAHPPVVEDAGYRYSWQKVTYTCRGASCGPYKSCGSVIGVRTERVPSKAPRSCCCQSSLIDTFTNVARCSNTRARGSRSARGTRRTGHNGNTSDGGGVDGLG